MTVGRGSLKVVVIDDYQAAAERFADWSAVGEPVDVVALREHLTDVGELAEALSGARVVVAMRERTAIGRELLDRLPDLELLVTTGPSNAAIDVEAAVARGVTVVGTGGILTPTSELTWGLVLALARRIPSEDASLRAGSWQRSVGIDLAGKTLGLLGLGRVGALVAEVGLAFKMEVIAWSENLTEERAAEVGVERVGRSELFERSDVLSVHLVLSERTRGLVGEAELRAMKPTALLVNTSRGPIVDESALARALEEGWIGGAGLDVYDVEPLPMDHPLRSAPSTVLTPHVGYVSDTLYELFYREIVEDVAAWLAGEPIRLVAAPTIDDGPQAPGRATADAGASGAER